MEASRPIVLVMKGNDITIGWFFSKRLTISGEAGHEHP
jgi:hypothetical protein